GNVLVFDIETVPDVKAGRQLFNLKDLSDEDVALAMRALRAQKTGKTDFLSHFQHQIVAISAVLLSNDSLKVWSLGNPASGEKELLERFFDGIEKFSPVLVSWNGNGFDLPVIHYRALKHGVASARYWDNGDIDREFRWNNYLSRFHARHLDLMDVLSGYQPRAFVPLDELAVMLGFPGKMGMSGAHVWESFCSGQIDAIRDYCETDVLNTYLVYLRFQQIRGVLTAGELEHEQNRLRDFLADSGRPHLAEFLARWRVLDSAP
ncbi:MAG: 3'-5' exonuclease, partial [Arenicellales bacterium]|nr:3'-5' exonuclease [Arenicellales bacterium]